MGSLRTILSFCLVLLAHQGIAASRLVEAIEFFQAEGDEKSIQKLIQDVEALHPFEQGAYEALALYFVKKRSREDLHQFTWNLSKRMHCFSTSDTLSRDCRSLKRFWLENLSNILFYETSSPGIAKARGQIALGDCQKAKTLLEEVESKEGPTESVFEVWEQMKKCEGLEEFLARKQESRKVWLIYSEKREE